MNNHSATIMDLQRRSGVVGKDVARFREKLETLSEGHGSGTAIAKACFGASRAVERLNAALSAFHQAKTKMCKYCLGSPLSL